jgi:hypothetical protein
MLTLRGFRFLCRKCAAAEMDFDGIVAGLERQRQGKMAKKWRKSESHFQVVDG